jgi:hypothetical protein
MIMTMKKDYYSHNVFGLLFLLCHLSSTTNTSVFIQAQSSSCVTAQTVQAGTPFVAVALTDATDDDISSQLNNNNLPASDLPPGHWFTYKTSLNETRTTLLSVDTIVADDFQILYEPDLAIFQGSCDSLSLVYDSNIAISIQIEVGVDYLIYVYNQYDNFSPYTLSIWELEPPENDKMENAVALTSQDLPFRGEFATYGARSDFSEDSCALEFESGVWFSYTTSFAQEEVSLQLEGFPFTFESGTSVGIQVGTGDQVTCIT